MFSVDNCLWRLVVYTEHDFHQIPLTDSCCLYFLKHSHSLNGRVRNIALLKRFFSMGLGKGWILQRLREGQVRSGHFFSLFFLLFFTKLCSGSVEGLLSRGLPCLV